MDVLVRYFKPRAVLLTQSSVRVLWFDQKKETSVRVGQVVEYENKLHFRKIVTEKNMVNSVITF